MKPIRLYLIVLTCLVTLVPDSARAQKFINLDDELGIGYVETVFQDSYGLLWIGSRNGLHSYDGYNVTSYVNDPTDPTSIPDNTAYSLSEDSESNLWFCQGSQGLAKMDRNSGQFVKVCPTGLEFNCDAVGYTRIIRDSSNAFWIGTDRGLILVSEDEQVLQWYRSDDSDSTALYGDFAYSLFLENKTTLWVGTRHGLNKLDRNTGEFTNPLNNSAYPTRQILDIKKSPEGNILVCPRFLPTRLMQYDRELDSFEPIDLYTDPALGEFKITYDHEGNLWISSRGVGAYMQAKGEDHFTEYLPLEANQHGYRNIYGLQNFTDKYGNVWFAGPQLHYMPSSGKKIENISTDGNIAISVFADNEYVWFCEKQPYRWNKATKRIEDYWPDERPVNLRSGIASTQARLYEYVRIDDDRFVVASTRNLFIWDKSNGTYEEYPSDQGGPFRDIAIDSARRSIWICGNQGRPTRFDIDKKVFEHYAPFTPIRNPQAVDVDRNGRVWFGTWTSGVKRYDFNDQSIVSFDPESEKKHRLSTIRVNDIEVDRHGNVWIATQLGLNRWDFEFDTIGVLRQKDGLPTDQINTVIIDDNDDIWLGTSKGLTVISHTDGSMRHFGQMDGLISSYYLPRACYKDVNGKLYFGGNQGIDMFYPDEMRSNHIAPDIYISALRVNDLPYDPGVSLFEFTNLELNYRQNFVEVELLGLHLTAPHANRYAYRINELHDDWIDLGSRRFVSLANSSPGTFTLEAKASNADGVWSDPKTLLTIVINPPYYRTWWFITLCGILLASLLYAGYRYRITQIRKKEQLKTEFETQIAQLEMKALRAQMNPHFLFNSLNSIKSLINAGESDKASEYVTRFSQLIRQVLSNSEQQLVRLQEDINALRLYMEIERLRFQNFTYSIHVSPGVNADFIEVPPLLLQPFVENAIWHGLLHKTDGDRRVDVRVDRIADCLVMEVQDNGIGRERAKRIKMRGGSRKGGLGMKITGDRIRILKEYYGQDAQIEVEDLVNEAGNPTGTLVRVRIPVSD